MPQHNCKLEYKFDTWPGFIIGNEKFLILFSVQLLYKDLYPKNNSLQKINIFC
jgi:hypothetical protein